MLKLLLDEHISRHVARGLQRRNRELVVHCLSEWEGSGFLGQQDALILKEAGARGVTLITYDLRTISPLLKSWIEEGRDHGGVIFVDEKTIPPSDFGGLIRALHQMWAELGHSDWVNRVIFLRRTK